MGRSDWEDGNWREGNWERSIQELHITSPEVHSIADNGGQAPSMLRNRDNVQSRGLGPETMQ